MPRLSEKPVPKTRFHGGRWRIYWKWNGKQYSIPTRYLEPKKIASVNSDLRLISAALAMDEPDFPESYAESPAVLRYMLDRYSRNTQSDMPTSPDWLGDYPTTLFSEKSKGWATHSLRYLKKLQEFSGGDIRMTTNAQAQEFLNSIIIAGNAPGTRNRTLAACSKFFKWAIRTKRTKRNPFEGIELLPEPDIEELVYCTRDERQEIIAMAEASGWPDWAAVPIAFYSGMRREEICRLQWRDLLFPVKRIKIRKSKTGKARDIPMATDLLILLDKTPESERFGYVVKMPGDTGQKEVDEITRPNRLTDLKIHLRREKEARLMKEWQITKPQLYTSKPRSLTLEQWKKMKSDYRKAKRDYHTQLANRKELLQSHLVRIGWNSFRHTFGSLLAQDGVSLDKITAWMGNTPEVCRKHYTQFVPRDRWDDEIDKVL